MTTDKYNIFVDFLQSSWPNVIIEESTLESFQNIYGNDLLNFITIYAKFKHFPNISSVMGKVIEDRYFAWETKQKKRQIVFILDITCSLEDFYRLTEEIYDNFLDIYPNNSLTNVGLGKRQ